MRNRFNTKTIALFAFEFMVYGNLKNMAAHWGYSSAKSLCGVASKLRSQGFNIPYRDL